MFCLGSVVVKLKNKMDNEFGRFAALLSKVISVRMFIIWKKTPKKAAQNRYKMCTGILMRILKLTLAFLLLSVSFACTPAQPAMPTASPTSPASPSPSLPTIPPTDPATPDGCTGENVLCNQVGASSSYPVGLGTPVPDLGFVPIYAESLPQLRQVLQRLDQSQLAAAISGDQRKIFFAATTGLFAYDRRGQLLAHWPQVLLYGENCAGCLAVNRNASRLAILTHTALEWVVAVYDVNGPALTPLREIPLGTSLSLIDSPGLVALSPNGNLLAYRSADPKGVVVMDLEKGDLLFKYKNEDADALLFSPSGSSFLLRRDRELLHWDISRWGEPAILLLPREDTPFAISPNDQFLALALSSEIRVHELQKFSLLRKISIAPSYVDDRTWLLAFNDDGTLRGLGFEPSRMAAPPYQTAAVWNVENGQTISAKAKPAENPDPFSAFWGTAFPETSGLGGVAAGPYNNFRFTDLDTLLINPLHAACWLKISTGQVECKNDDTALVYGSEISAYRQFQEENPIQFKNWNGSPVFSTRTSPIVWVSRTMDIALTNAAGSATDLYLKNNPDPVLSVPGVLKSASENARAVVFSTRVKDGTQLLAVVEKSSYKMLFQKRSAAYLEPVVMTPSQTIYFLSHDRRTGVVTIQMILPGTQDVLEMTHFPLDAVPSTLAYAESGILAIGFDDGRVVLVTMHSLKTATFQAIYAPIEHLTFSPDGRYLGVAGRHGFSLFAMLP